MTISRAETAVARLPFFSPEPCVAVLHAPATEICGNEARLCSAKPLPSRYGESCPYVMPALTVTVRAFESSATTSSIDFKERKSSVLSAMLLKQCRVPSTFNLLCFLT